MSKSSISDFFQDAFRQTGNDGRQKDAGIDETLLRWRREADDLSAIGTKPFDMETFKRLNGPSMRCYFRMPTSWQTHPEAWRCYVQWAIGRQLAEKEAPGGAILAFMLEKSIGFSGSQQLLLSFFGDQLFSEHRELFIALIYQELKKKGDHAHSLVDIGRILIKQSKKKVSSTSSYSLSEVVEKADRRILDLCFRFFFAHHPLDAFVDAIEELPEWDFFIPYYGEQGISGFSGGKRYLISRDMGI